MKSLELPKASIAEGFRKLPEDFLDCFWSDMKFRARDFLKNTLELTLNYEAELAIGAGKYQRAKERKGYRNGTRNRKVLYTDVFGKIKNFSIPRVEGVVFKSKVLQPYKRRTSDFETAILNFYVRGQSTRRLRDSFKAMFGTDFSHNMVSEILQKLQAKLESWRRRTLEKEYIALVVDGVWLNLRTVPQFIKKGLKNGTKGVVLAVMGIRENGDKEIVGFKIARSESEAEYSGLFLDLIDRGLKLKRNGLIIHDGFPGLEASIALNFPYHKKQLCVFHFIASTITKIRHQKYSKKIKKDLSDIYRLSLKQKQAVSALKKFCLKWRNIEPILIKYVNNIFSRTLTYLDYEPEYHRMFKTTNYLERSFKQIKRKIRDIGVFPNMRSAERIFFLEVLHLNFGFTGEKPFYA